MATDSENPSATITNNSSVEKPAKTLDEVKDSNDVVVVDSTSKSGPSSVSDTEKKIRRAERFGITVQLSEQEKRNSRAERFGTGSSTIGSGVSKKSEEVNSDASKKSEVSSDASKKSEELKRKARAERFGIAAPENVSVDEVKKKARLERFGSIPKLDSQEEEKRKARALRFAQAPATSVSINGAGNIEPKAAIAGDAVGGS